MAATKSKGKKPYAVIIEDTENITRKQWLQARKPYVCGSDSPIAAGLSHFNTPVGLYEDKIDPNVHDDEYIDAELKFRLDCGNALEPVIHKHIGYQINAKHIRDKSMCVSTIYSHMACDIDGLYEMLGDRVIQGVHFKEGDILLYEGKTTNAVQYAEWRWVPPAMYVMQCKHNMIVRGLRHCVLGISRGTNDLKNDVCYHLIALTEEDERVIPLICQEFMENCVQKRTPPSEAVGPYVSEYKRALIAHLTKYTKPDGATLKLPTGLIRTLDDSLKAREELAALNAQVRVKESERDAIELPLVAALGDKYQYGELDTLYRTIKIGYTIAQWPVVTSDNLSRLERENTELYGQLVKEGYITDRVDRKFTVRARQKKATTYKQRGKGVRV